MSHPIRFRFARPFVQAAAAPCTACDGDGYLLGEDDIARSCSCRPARIAAEYLTRAQLPAAAFPAVRDGLTAPSVDPVARSSWRMAWQMFGTAVGTAAAFERGEYPDTPLITAGVIGPPGSGKTWLLAGAVREAAIERLGALFVSMADPFSLLTRLGGAKGRDHARELLLRVPVLAADDVGGHRHETASGLVRDILLERGDASRVTLIAARGGVADLEREFGASLADRVRAGHVALAHGSLRGR